MRLDVSITVVARLLTLMAGLAASILTARFLGPDGRGDYFFVITLTAAIVQFANLGLHASNTYEVARDESLFSALVANSMWVSLVVGGGGGALAAFILFASRSYPEMPRELVWFAAALSPATLFFLLGTNLFVGMNRIGLFNLFEVTSRLLVVLFLAVAGALAASVYVLLGASLAAWSVSSFVLFLLLRRHSGGRLAFDGKVFRRGLHFASKAYLLTLLGFLVLRSSVFLLEGFHGSSEVGYFSVSTQVADALAIVPTSAALVLFPRLVRNPGESWSIMLRSCAVVAGVLSVVCCAVGLAAGLLVRLAFGADFASAVPMIHWILPGVVAVGVCTVISQYLAAIGLPRSLVGIWIAGAAIAIGLGWLLIPRFGGVGASATLSGTYVAILFCVVILAFRHRHSGERDIAAAALTSTVALGATEARPPAKG